MTLDQFINILVTITLIEMMAATGLGVALADLLAVVRDWRVVVKAALANYVCVPAATVGLLLLFADDPYVAAGFLILAVCPGAPYGPPFTAIARGNVAAAVGLMAILAGSSAVVAPLLLSFLLPLLAGGDEPLNVNAAQIVGTLLLTQLIPLGVGVAVRHWRPLLAQSLQGPATLVSKVLNLLVVVFILATQWPLLMKIRPRGFVGMLGLLLASLAAGWLLGGPDRDRRKAMTLTTALRNVGVGLVVATAAFPGKAAVTAVLAYGLFAIVGSLLLALGWGRQPESPRPQQAYTESSTQ